MTGSTLAYANRLGAVYFLHAGKTKTGKVRYFVAKAAGAGALASMPDGFEFTESVNGVVSVRRIDPSAPAVHPGHLALIREELARQAHLPFHRAEAVRADIVVFEPAGGLDPQEIGWISRSLGLGPQILEQRLSGRAAKRFTPVLRFEPCGPGEYELRRMTYHGDGGWSWPLARGPIQKLARRYLPVVGTERFFELL